MSCFFCGYNNHVSQNCDFYFTDKERQRILSLRNCCRSCLTAFEENSNGVDEEFCKNCESYRKCYICFSREHHTVFCPERLKASNFFSPNIDKDLLTRFIQLLTVDEKYLLFLSLPTIFEASKINPPEVVASKLENILNNKKLQKSNLVVVNNLYVEFYHRCIITNNTESFSTPEIFRNKNIQIRCSADSFLKLLSCEMKLLWCSNMKFIPEITFAEVIQKAPNLEQIDFYCTNIEVNNSWIDDLLQFNQAANFKELHLPINGLDFDSGKLAALINTKSAKIRLYINPPCNQPFNKQKFLKKVTAKLSPYFVGVESDYWKSLKIFHHNVFIQNYKLVNA